MTVTDFIEKEAQEALDILDKVETLGGQRKLKEDLLKANASNHVLKFMFEKCYDWLQTFNLTVDAQARGPTGKSVFGKMFLTPGQAVEAFNDLLEKYKVSTLTGNAAREAWNNLMSQVDGNCRYWFAKVLNRDMKMGVGPGTIAKAWPGMLSTFAVQLANTYYAEDVYDDGELAHKKTILVCPTSPKSKINEHWWHFPLIGEPKLDGMRVTSIEGKGYSRGALEVVPIRFIAEACRKVAPAFGVDGEIMSKFWGDTTGLVHTKDENLTDEERQALEEITYHVFDCFDTQYFYKGFELTIKNVTLAGPGLKKTEFVPIDPRQLIDRRKTLEYVVGEVNKLLPKGNLKLVPQVVINSEAEIETAYSTFVAQGYEGIMLKYPEAPYFFDRTDCWLKLKPIETIEAKILQVLPGDASKRNENRLGRLVVQMPDGSEARIGTGYSDEQREELWKIRDKLVGKKAEFKVQKDPTQIAVARFPRFIKIRWDL